jgi:hypothetical protein
LRASALARDNERGMLEAEAPKGAALDPFQAELVTAAAREADGQESKEARSQRERMKKVRARAAKAEGVKA